MRHVERTRFGIWEFLSDGSWPSYFVCGTLAIVLSWVLSGCRIGNHVANGPASGGPVPVSNDGITGVYGMVPNELGACVTRISTGKQTCLQAPLTDIPASIQQVLTNPVGMIYYSTTNPPTAGIFNPSATADQNGNVPGYKVDAVASSRSVSYDNTASTAFFLDSTCTASDETIITGTLNTTDAGQVINSWTIFGRADLTYGEIATIAGTCAATYPAIINCYNDTSGTAAQCQQTTTAANLQVQTFWKAFFAPFLDAGVMTSVADVSDISVYEFVIGYQ